MPPSDLPEIPLDVSPDPSGGDVQADGGTAPAGITEVALPEADDPGLAEPEASDVDQGAGEPAAVAAEAADLVGERPCPLCDGAGSIPYGLRQSPRYRTCEECGGVGQVTTGSLVSEAAVSNCEGCNGAGYVSSQPAVSDTAPSFAPVTPATEPPWPGAIFDASNGQWR